MSQIFPSEGIAKKWKQVTSALDTLLLDTTTVASNRWGIIYKFFVDLDVASEADLENLPAKLEFAASVGSFNFKQKVHPLIEHTSATPQNFRFVDLGPWGYDFGPDGLYTGIKGDNVIVSCDAAGTGIVSRIHFQYSD